MVSIIVPVFNVQDYISECLDSLCGQDYEDIEILVVNDGSTDESGRICDLYSKKDSRIKVIHQENKGLSCARNTALAVANGDYFMFVDSDDYVAKNYVSYMVSIMKNDQKADMGICRFYNNIEQEDGSFFQSPCVSQPEKYVMSGQEILPKRFDKLKLYYVVSWNKIYKRELFNKLCFPADRVCEDAWISLDLYQICKRVICTDELLYYYRNRRTSISHFPSINWIIAQMEWLEREIDFFSESADCSDMIYPSKPYVSLFYKNRCRLSISNFSSHYRYWKKSIHFLLRDNRISLTDKLKYWFYYYTFHCRVSRITDV